MTVAITCECCAGHTPLCDSCVAQHLSWLGGTAAARGYAWAQHVIEQLGPDRALWKPWPAFTGRARAIALAKIAGLSDDSRLNEGLAARCHEEAARLYARGRANRAG